jgi:hypothetical protein
VKGFFILVLVLAQIIALYKTSAAHAIGDYTGGVFVDVQTTF